MDKEKKTIQGFGKEWTTWGDIDYLYRNEKELVEEFKAYGMPESFFENKVILDAGCGMGRNSYVVAKYFKPKEITCIDPSESVESAKKLLAQFANVKVVKENIFNLQLGENNFDSIMSIGVLHHTKDPEGAFNVLLKFLKPGGEIYLMIYEKPKTLLRKIDYLIFDKILRKILCRLPHKFIKIASYFMAIPHAIITFFKPYRGDGLRQRPYKRAVADIFDAYCCPYRFVYDKEEVFKWYERAGLVDIRTANPDRDNITIIGKKPENGG